jgi:hypothetical protein
LSFERRTTVRLKVVANDTACEITILRNAEPIAREQGLLERDLPLGIYSLTARVGFDVYSKPISLDGTKAEVVEEVPVLEFPSPAPLKDTTNLRSEHAAAAKRESRHVHVKTGNGSWIFVFVRDWRKGALVPASQLLQGVRLRSFDDNVLVDLQAAGVTRAKTYPWAACNIAIDPGVYRLTVDMPSGERFSQTAVATLGWQTQFFLLTDSTQATGLDLNGAAILFYRRDRPSASFDSEDSDLRMVEWARYSLPTNAESVLTYVRNRVDGDKRLHPMLAMFAAHQFIARGNGDRVVASSIVTDLARRGFGDHPDVRALTIALDENRVAEPFRVPPMLRRSWDLLVRNTVRNPDLIPTDSLAGQVGMRVWGEEPWMIWREPPASDADVEKNERAADLEERLERDLRRLGAEWWTQSQRDEWRLKQVSSLGIPLRELEQLIAKIRARDTTHELPGPDALSARALRDAILATFSPPEETILRSDLEEQLASEGIDIRLGDEDLGGDVRALRVQNLIDALKRINRLALLVTAVRKQNPGALQNPGSS